MACVPAPLGGPSVGIWGDEVFGLMILAVVSALVLWLSWRIFRGGRALRKRGVRTQAKCVNIAGGPNGNFKLTIEFTADGGQGVRTTVAPFDVPPVRPGGLLGVVYDPLEPVNVSTPDRVGNGRVALSFVVVSATALLLTAGLIALNVLALVLG
ncbi:MULTISPECIES: hypothetical protein [unclassified Streptomyces]|uniref:hypothetical protein n=1 Tax=unclassified Streptomyces TaxID=2593676 RepID=UPI000361904F|nr:MULTISPECIES: hypothetical protein [unclassified Streptomyces]MYX37254.1 hypothetical protein [Streptomyces sp. SID8377]